MTEKPDFSIRDEGSIILLYAHTQAAMDWCDEHLPAHKVLFGGAVVVEHNYADDLIMCIMLDGLSIANGGQIIEAKNGEKVL